MRYIVCNLFGARQNLNTGEKKISVSFGANQK